MKTDMLKPALLESLMYQTGIPRQFIPYSVRSAGTLHIKIMLKHPWGIAAVPSQNGRDFRPEILREYEARMLADHSAPTFTDCVRATSGKDSALGGGSQRVFLQA